MNARKQKAPSARASRGEVPPGAKEEMMRQLTFPPRYNHAVGASNLENIGLVGLRFELLPQFFDHDLPALSLKLLQPQFQHDPKTGLATAIFSWRIAGTRASESVLTIEADFVVACTGFADVESDAVIAFMSNVGKFACYPYLRTTISWLSGASGANLPILPLLKNVAPPGSAAPHKAGALRTGPSQRRRKKTKRLTLPASEK